MAEAPVVGQGDVGASSKRMESKRMESDAHALR